MLLAWGSKVMVKTSTSHVCRSCARSSACSVTWWPATGDVPQEQLQRQLAANGGVGRNPVQLPFILIQVNYDTNVMLLKTGIIDAGLLPVPSSRPFGRLYAPTQLWL